jgi:hypothetical protein
MENLEQRCLEKLNKILSKFNLKIEIFYNASLTVWQYHLVDNFLPNNTYADWLYSWSSILDMLTCCNSIFECLDTYTEYSEDGFNLYTYQRYSEAYNAIKYLENICCLEELIIKMDLMGI